MNVLIFTLDQVRCGIPIGDVVEIVRAVAVSPLPGAPPVVEGVIDLRGTIVPVFDTRRALWGTHSPIRLDDHFIIVLTRTRYAALRVDHAHEIATVGPHSVHDIHEHVTMSRIVSGVAALPDGMLFINDVRQFLTEAEEASMEELLAASSASLLKSGEDHRAASGP